MVGLSSEFVCVKLGLVLCCSCSTFVLGFGGAVPALQLVRNFWRTPNIRRALRWDGNGWWHGNIAV